MPGAKFAAHLRELASPATRTKPRREKARDGKGDEEGIDRRAQTLFER